MGGEGGGKKRGGGQSRISEGGGSEIDLWRGGVEGSKGEGSKEEVNSRGGGEAEVGKAEKVRQGWEGREVK